MTERDSQTGVAGRAACGVGEASLFTSWRPGAYWLTERINAEYRGAADAVNLPTAA
ncbi:hypothetical protein SAMN02745831_07342 [Streptomyces sp. PgraA7]|nr:hypothetical protein SAMN02745831_07342 [Streptomyces sp. PgraA7]